MLFARVLRSVAIFGLAVTGLAGAPRTESFAQGQPSAPKPEMMENCPGLIATDAPRLIPASLRRAALEADRCGSPMWDTRHF